MDRDGLTLKCRAKIVSRELDSLVNALEDSLDQKNRSTDSCRCTSGK